MTKLIWWKALTVLTFIISFSLLFIKIYDSLPPPPEYEVRIIELNNTNFYKRIRVIDYLCDDGIKVSNIQNDFTGIHSFYASAWRDASVHEGKCAIKVIKE